MRNFKLAVALGLGISAIALGGCATGFPTQVSRYQAMPAPQGQSFAVVPMDARLAGGLEFSRFASMVAGAMQAQGYVPAANVNNATMIVRVGYGVDQGRTEYERDFIGARDPFFYGYGAYPSRYGGYYGHGGLGGYGSAYYGRPYYSRWGYYGARSPFYYGWSDPFYNSRFGGISSYTIYQSFLDLDIRRKSDNVALFEGRARARSGTDNLGTLVPNLVEAMFTGFPGRSGETVRITVPTAPRR